MNLGGTGNRNSWHGPRCDGFAALARGGRRTRRARHASPLQHGARLRRLHRCPCSVACVHQPPQGASTIQPSPSGPGSSARRPRGRGTPSWRGGRRIAADVRRATPVSPLQDGCEPSEAGAPMYRHRWHRQRSAARDGRGVPRHNTTGPNGVARGGDGRDASASSHRGRARPSLPARPHPAGTLAGSVVGADRVRLRPTGDMAEETRALPTASETGRSGAGSLRSLTVLRLCRSAR